MKIDGKGRKIASPVFVTIFLPKMERERESQKWKQMRDIRLHEKGLKRTNIQLKQAVTENFGWNMQYCIITQQTTILEV